MAAGSSPDAGRVVLCVGMFPGHGPRVREHDRPGGQGRRGSPLHDLYYLGATFGSVLPGYAWQPFGWTGVVATCLAAFAVGLLADLALCA